MVRPTALVVSLLNVDRDDTLFVGGKGANLGEMISAGFPVPGGFIITSASYSEFIKENRLSDKIQHLLSTINYERDESLGQVARNIQKLIKSAPIPGKISDAVINSYEKLGNVYVAVRSSATSEDSKSASFAGQNETFLNIRGDSVLLNSARAVWASLFEPRSIFYRHEKKIPHLKTGIAIVVQKMIDSDSSGVMFTVDPVTSDKGKIVIEAIFGLGEYIVQGKVTPDHYEVHKEFMQIITKSVNRQNVMLTKVGGEDKNVEIPDSKRNKQKIDDEEIIALANLGEEIEKHYYFPQDIEWAKADGKIYIVQTRPITTLGSEKGKVKREKSVETTSHLSPLNSHPVLVGDPASPGIGVGKVCILESPKHLSKLVQGDVLVASMTNPDYVPAMKKASAIITERGGRTSHAAIVAREFGIPAVVGAPGAMKKLKDGQVITVNGATGEIFKGARYVPVKHESKHPDIKTATKLLVNIAEPEVAVELATRNVDGIGLLRAEFMIAQIGIHPKKLIHDKKQHVFIDKLAEGLVKICRAFYPRPVLYRTTDFKSNEYAELSGGRAYEPVESNPMLGFRGAFRYVRDAAVFKLELEAIKQVREKMGFNNLNLMIPFVRTVDELTQVKKIIANEGLKRSHTFKLFMMVEIPSNVILIEDFINTGIDGVSIGSNDLTMLILGTDRDNSEVAQVFDERNPAVVWAFERVIRACRKNKIPVSICGQAPSVYPSLVEDLVMWGIDSVSVSPDAIDNTRRVIHAAESRIVNKIQ